MLGLNWSTIKWPQIKLTSPINFYQCDISDSSFYGINLVGMTLDSCKAHQVDFREVDLSNASLTNTDLYKSLFVHTNLRHADLTDSINYNIDINLNNIQGARFAFPEVIGLLTGLDIKISGLENI